MHNELLMSRRGKNTQYQPDSAFTQKHWKKNKEMLQEKAQQQEIQEDMQLVLQDIERKNLELQVCYNKMKDKTNELEEENEKLQKQRSEMQHRFNERLRQNTELVELNDNLMCKNTEMQVQKREQKKTHKDLQCTL